MQQASAGGSTNGTVQCGGGARYVVYMALLWLHFNYILRQWCILAWLPGVRSLLSHISVVAGRAIGVATCQGPTVRVKDRSRRCFLVVQAILPALSAIVGYHAL